MSKNKAPKTIDMSSAEDKIQAVRKQENADKALQDFLNSFISDGYTETVMNGFTIRRNEDGIVEVFA